ncbi:acetolactate synthase-1/2/3 large subunit [Haloechinothrix alba]|uniref:Acetolactate synthase-1/2/3 large subunit n=1 Tax=Haloechinothrix alba TaxID=664784 RepID=A0A238ZWN6_9PSEU|nr:acetolactate synthase [Haloechinothrix alba]SNR87308.1 acetolactate synthase-1/2/3 large subunit [Haloechinothrix alba]
MTQVTGHGGRLATDVARTHGIRTMFTLSGGHVFPLYDGALQGEPPLRLVDVRHEQTAVFAAEGTARLTRTPGLAVLTAGPGITNGVSGVTTAHFNGSPLLTIGGRAPQARWGSGSLQELDHPPLLAPVTKLSATIERTEKVPYAVHDALQVACTPHRGPVFLDIPIEQVFGEATSTAAPPAERQPVPPDQGRLDEIARLMATAQRPVLVLGSDVWTDGAEDAARRAAETIGLPTITNGTARGVLPAGHPLLVTRARSRAFGAADLVVVVGTPLDFRLGYGSFGGKDGSPAAQVCHIADSPEQLAGHVDLAGSASGDLTLALDGLTSAWQRQSAHTTHADWAAELRRTADAAIASDAADLDSDAVPIHPARIYRELLRHTDDDTVVIGDGGDFVSYAGRYVEPRRPGCWLDPGPYGCLGTGLGYAMAARLARPSSPVVLLLGDGAAGFSLMDVDTLVRHRLPVVMIMGNNSGWGLEKHPMQFLYGYHAAAELGSGTRYDEVVRALGGGGEMVTEPGEIGPALRRALDADVPYLVNVITDPDNAYPRSTMGI